RIGGVLPLLGRRRPWLSRTHRLSSTLWPIAGVRIVLGVLIGRGGRVPFAVSALDLAPLTRGDIVLRILPVVLLGWRGGLLWRRRVCATLIGPVVRRIRLETGWGLSGIVGAVRGARRIRARLLGARCIGPILLGRLLLLTIDLIESSIDLLHFLGRERTL